MVLLPMAISGGIKVSYKAIVGFNYPDDKGGEVRVEEGTILESLPEAHAESILAQGCLEEIASEPKKGKEGR